jgi:thiamine-monophosphate kinase
MQSAEDKLIAKFFKPLATHAGALGLTDDAAFITPRGNHELVVTADAIVEGKHFLSSNPPDTIGRKALRVNLSDLAAKGAEPVGFLMSIGLPQIREDWLGAFARGLMEDANTYACPLLGGDTVNTSGPLFVSITAIGDLPRGGMVKRSGAKKGDLVMLTGTIGDAAIGLALASGKIPGQWGLGRDECDHLVGRYLVPEPRNALASALRLHASAAMDVSDGLFGDLGKLCAASGVSADVEIKNVPISWAAGPALDKVPELIETMLTGGDDYEIVCTIPPDRERQFVALARDAKVDVKVVGKVVEGRKPPRFLDANGKALTVAQASFSHF